MRNLQAPLAAALFAVTFLSGCTLPSTDETSARGGVVADANTYTISLINFNGQSSPMMTQSENFTWPQVRNNTDFQFTHKVEGTPVLPSKHVGGHFGPDFSDAPSKVTYPIPCNHIEGTLPSMPDGFTITCRAPAQTGTYHLRGHAQHSKDNKTTDWWSPDFVFRVI